MAKAAKKAKRKKVQASQWAVIVQNPRSEYVADVQPTRSEARLASADYAGWATARVARVRITEL